MVEIRDVLAQMYETTRPYGGKIVITDPGESHNPLIKSLEVLNLPGSEIQSENNFSVITRTGSLQGASPGHTIMEILPIQ